LVNSNKLFDEPFLRRLEALTLVARQAQTGRWQGERRSLKRGQSVEFADYRTYVPGDDFRLLDWNAYARLERFFIKLFVEEEDLTVHLLLDTSRSMDWPPGGGPAHKLTYACRAAGALGYIALAGLDRVTAAGVSDDVGQSFAPHRGRGQSFAFFNFLANLPPAGGTDLSQALRRYAVHARQPGPLLLFSDLFDPTWQEGLMALLSRRFEITLIHLLAPDEADPPLTGDLRLLDAETGQSVELTADYEALARYKAGLAAWQAEIRHWCAGRTVAYVSLTTATPFEEFIFAFLRRRGILR
jgi:uncharacterized protein (DUF58 family)